MVDALVIGADREEVGALSLQLDRRIDVPGRLRVEIGIGNEHRQCAVVAERNLRRPEQQVEGRARIAAANRSAIDDAIARAIAGDHARQPLVVAARRGDEAVARLFVALPIGALEAVMLETHAGNDRQIAGTERCHGIGADALLLAVEPVLLQLDRVEAGELRRRQAANLVLDEFGIEQLDRHLRGIVHEAAQHLARNGRHRRPLRVVARGVAAIGEREVILERTVVAQAVRIALGPFRLGAGRDRFEPLIGQLPGRVELPFQAALPGILELLRHIPLFQRREIEQGRARRVGQHHLRAGAIADARHHPRDR